MPQYTAAQRLHHKSQFDSLYGSGRRFSDAFFLVLTRPNQVDHPRIGLSVSIRSVGIAVNRNRVKRVVREFFRLHQHQLPPLDIVVSARNAARDAPNKALSESLARHWRNVVNACAKS